MLCQHIDSASSTGQSGPCHTDGHLIISTLLNIVMTSSDVCDCCWCLQVLVFTSSGQIVLLLLSNPLFFMCFLQIQQANFF